MRRHDMTRHHREDDLGSSVPESGTPSSARGDDAKDSRRLGEGTAAKAADTARLRQGYGSQGSSLPTKLSGLLAVVFALLLPTSASAQSIMLKDLTGAWSKEEKPGNFRLLFVRPDSTFITSRWRAGPANPYLPINYLRGDTISLSKSDSPAVCRGERAGYCGEPGYKITLKDQQLTLTSLSNTGTYYSGTYTRVNVEFP
jgi:hypothetical protein